MTQEHMKQNNVLNSKDNKYNSDRSIKYCSKCLGLLGDDRVRDYENNEFCSCECKVDFHLERKQDIDDILSNFK